MSYTYDFRLKSVLLKENGESIDLKGNTLLSVVIYAPNSTQRTVETVLTLPIVNKDKGEDVEGLLPANQVYTTDHVIPRNPANIFKISLEGEDIEIIARILVSKSPSKLIPIIRKVIPVVISAGSGIIGGVGGVILSGAVNAAVQTVFDSKELKDKVTLLGTGMVYPLLYNGMEPGDLHFNLEVPIDIISKYPKDTGKENENGEALLTAPKIKAGSQIAHVVLSVNRTWDGSGPEPVLTTASSTKV